MKKNSCLEWSIGKVILSVNWSQKIILVAAWKSTSLLPARLLPDDNIQKSFTIVRDGCGDRSIPASRVG